MSSNTIEEIGYFANDIIYHEFQRAQLKDFGNWERKKKGVNVRMYKVYRNKSPCDRE